MKTLGATAAGCALLGEVVATPELRLKVVLDSGSEGLVFARGCFVLEDAIESRGALKGIDSVRLGDAIAVETGRALHVVAAAARRVIMGSSLHLRQSNR